MNPPRKYIRLGPGGLIYIIVTALIVSAAIYTQANLLFWAFGLLIGGLIVSLLLAWWMLRAVSVQRLLPGHAVCGQPLVIRYHLSNRSWLPAFSVVVQETWGKGGRGWRKTGPVGGRPQRLRGRPLGWVLHLGPQQSMQAEAVCWPLRRGAIKFQRILVSSAFPFGIIKRVVAFEQPGEVRVFPRLFRMNRRLLFSLSHLDPSGRKQVDKPGGMEEFFGIRPYRAGDSLRLIDWKRTAHTGELIAREMTQPTPPRVLILLDLTQTSGAARPDPRTSASPASGPKRRWWLPWEKARDRAAAASPRPPLSQNSHSLQSRASGDAVAAMSPQEQAISLTASLICDAYFHGYQVGLVAAGVVFPSFPVHHSLPHRTRMLEALAHIDLARRGPTTASLPEHPSVIVRPGADNGDAGGRPASPRRSVTLDATELARYVATMNPRPEAAAGLLRRAPRPTSRREETRASEARGLESPGFELDERPRRDDDADRRQHPH